MKIFKQYLGRPLRIEVCDKIKWKRNLRTTVLITSQNATYQHFFPIYMVGVWNVVSYSKGRNITYKLLKHIFNKIFEGEVDSFNCSGVENFIHFRNYDQFILFGRQGMRSEIQFIHDHWEVYGSTLYLLLWIFLFILLDKLFVGHICPVATYNTIHTCC